jgi:hypothetical protein
MKKRSERQAQNRTPYEQEKDCPPLARLGMSQVLPCWTRRFHTWRRHRPGMERVSHNVQRSCLWPGVAAARQARAVLHNAFGVEGAEPSNVWGSQYPEGVESHSPGLAQRAYPGRPATGFLDSLPMRQLLGTAMLARSYRPASTTLGFPVSSNKKLGKGQLGKGGLQGGQAAWRITLSIPTFERKRTTGSTCGRT